MIAVMSRSFWEAASELAGPARLLDEGATLFACGDPVRYLHRVRSGVVHLVRCDVSGRELIVQRASAGDIVAEASVFAARYHCDAVAVCPSVLETMLVLPLRARLCADPVLSEAFAAHLAQQVQRTRTMAEIVTLRTVAERLDAWLIFAEASMPPRGEWRHLAERLGVTPEALYRELARRKKPAPETGAGQSSSQGKTLTCFRRK